MGGVSRDDVTVEREVEYMFDPSRVPDPSTAAAPAEEPVPEQTAEVVRALADSHGRFLSFVERRVGDRALAEDILQDAFVRSLEKANTVRSRESATAWFYRSLRNAVIDRYRRHGAASRALAAFAAELAGEADEEARAAICQCVTHLAEGLKPEYAAALLRIDVEGLPVKDYAAEAGISRSNAGVRVFRARDALRRQVARACGACAEHGCRDCTCGDEPSPQD